MKKAVKVARPEAKSRVDSRLRPGQALLQKRLSGRPRPGEDDSDVPDSPRNDRNEVSSVCSTVDTVGKVAHGGMSPTKSFFSKAPSNPWRLSGSRPGSVPAPTSPGSGGRAPGSPGSSSSGSPAGRPSRWWAELPRRRPADDAPSPGRSQGSRASSLPQAAARASRSQPQVSTLRGLPGRASSSQLNGTHERPNAQADHGCAGPSSVASNADSQSGLALQLGFASAADADNGVVAKGRPVTYIESSDGGSSVAGGSSHQSFRPQDAWAAGRAELEEPSLETRPVPSACVSLVATGHQGAPVPALLLQDSAGADSDCGMERLRLGGETPLSGASPQYLDSGLRADSGQLPGTSEWISNSAEALQVAGAHEATELAIAEGMPFLRMGSMGSIRSQLGGDGATSPRSNIALESAPPQHLGPAADNRSLRRGRGQSGSGWIDSQGMQRKQELLAGSDAQHAIFGSPRTSMRRYPYDNGAGQPDSPHGQRHFSRSATRTKSAGSASSSPSKTAFESPSGSYAARRAVDEKRVLEGASGASASPRKPAGASAGRLQAGMSPRKVAGASIQHVLSHLQETEPVSPRRVRAPAFASDNAAGCSTGVSHQMEETEPASPRRVRSLSSLQDMVVFDSAGVPSSYAQRRATDEGLHVTGEGFRTSGADIMPGSQYEVVHSPRNLHEFGTRSRTRLEDASPRGTPLGSPRGFMRTGWCEDGEPESRGKRTKPGYSAGGPSELVGAVLFGPSEREHISMSSPVSPSFRQTRPGEACTPFESQGAEAGMPSAQMQRNRFPPCSQGEDGRLASSRSPRLSNDHKDILTWVEHCQSSPRTLSERGDVLASPRSDSNPRRKFISPNNDHADLLTWDDDGSESASSQHSGRQRQRSSSLNSTPAGNYPRHDIAQPRGLQCFAQDTSTQDDESVGDNTELIRPWTRADSSSPPLFTRKGRAILPSASEAFQQRLAIQQGSKLRYESGILRRSLSAPPAQSDWNPTQHGRPIVAGLPTQSLDALSQRRMPPSPRELSHAAKQRQQRNLQGLEVGALIQNAGYYQALAEMLERKVADAQYAERFRAAADVKRERAQKALEVKNRVFNDGVAAALQWSES